MRLATKIIALPLLLVLAFAINAYAATYFAGYLFPLVVPRPYVEMVGAAVVGAVAAAAAIAWPLVRLYGGRAWVAAIAVASPVVALRAGDFLHYAGTGESRIIVMSCVEGLVYPVVILVGIWLASMSSHARGENAA
jgi:hypothetical protein